MGNIVADAKFKNGPSAECARDVIELTFEDDKVAMLKMDGNTIVPDNAAADAGAMMDPNAYAVGDDLAQCASICTVSRVDNGMIRTPLIKSEDRRIRGAKSIANQESTLEFAASGADGWRAVVNRVKTFATTDPVYETEEYGMVLTHDHLGPGATSAGFPRSDVFGISGAVVLCPAKIASYQIIISEAPPPEDGSEMPVYTVDDAKASVAGGVDAIRNIVARLPNYVLPEEDLTANLDPREQARLLAQKQREKIKADLASTMGAGKFDLEAGRAANAAAANAANAADEE